MNNVGQVEKLAPKLFVHVTLFRLNISGMKKAFSVTGVGSSFKSSLFLEVFSIG